MNRSKTKVRTKTSAKTDTPLGQLMKLMNIVRCKMESSAPKNTDKLVPHLIKRGFQLKDIETAIKWLAIISLAFETDDKATSVAIPARVTDPGFEKPPALRHLHAFEAVRLSPDAQRHILELLYSGDITPLQFERTVEYLWHHDLREVSPTRLELILSLNAPKSYERTDGQSGVDETPQNNFFPILIN